MKRVVVTGMGVVSPLGNNVTTMWNSLLNSQSGVSKLTKDDLSDFESLDVKIGGKVNISLQDMEKLTVFFS